MGKSIQGYLESLQIGETQLFKNLTMVQSSLWREILRTKNRKIQEIRMYECSQQ